MRKILTTVLLISCLFSNAQMTMVNGTAKVLASGYTFNCVYALPKTYSTTTAYPLVLEFSGTGQAGTNIQSMYTDGLPQVLQGGYQPPFDFIMAAPQAQSYGINPDYVQYILADVESKYNIDKSRIYIVSFSAGGWGTLGSVMNELLPFGSNFAAFAPLSAATQDLTMSGVSNFTTCKVPVWEVIGANDISYVQNNQALAANINSLVPNLAHIYLQAGQGHGGWNNAFNGTFKDSLGRTMWDFLYANKLGNIFIAPAITSATVALDTTGKAFTYTITANNKPASFNATNLPIGLTINTTTGIISGTPTIAATTVIGLSATNSAGTGTSTLTLTVVNPLPIVIQTIQLYNNGSYKTF